MCVSCGGDQCKGLWVMESGCESVEQDHALYWSSLAFQLEIVIVAILKLTSSFSSYSRNCICFRRYLFGKKMDGNAFVVFGVMDGVVKTSIVNSLKKVPVRYIKYYMFGLKIYSPHLVYAWYEL